jgi:hypothetical protein
MYMHRIYESVNFYTRGVLDELTDSCAPCYLKGNRDVIE